MHCYGFKKEEIETLTMSQISTLFEMYGCMKNPEWLKKYKKMSFNSWMEFEQYLLHTMKFI